jgi:hypothetical protein
LDEMGAHQPSSTTGPASALHLPIASFFREAAFHAFPKISNYLIRLALPSSGIWSILLA